VGFGVESRTRAKCCAFLWCTLYVSCVRVCVCVVAFVWVWWWGRRLPLHPVGVVAHPTVAHKWLLSFSTPLPPAVLTLAPKAGSGPGDMSVTLQTLPPSCVALPETATESASTAQKRVTNNHCCAWGPPGSIIVATSLVRGGGPLCARVCEMVVVGGVCLAVVGGRGSAPPPHGCTPVRAPAFAYATQPPGAAPTALSW
jgi:hypothetical protein